MPPISTPDFRQLQGQLSDIGTKLSNIMGHAKDEWTGFKNAGDRVKDLGNWLDFLSQQLKKTSDVSDRLSIGKQMKLVEKDLARARVEASKFFQAMKTGTDIMDSFGKSIIGIGLSGFTLGLQQLSKGVHKVYDLFERWTKVMGEFNMKVGSASNNMKSAQKFGLAWEGTIRGLTDQMGAGMQMAGDFIESFDRMPFDTKEKEGKRFATTMLGLARGFNLGGEGAGKFADMMQRLSVTRCHVRSAKRSSCSI